MSVEKIQCLTSVSGVGFSIGAPYTLLKQMIERSIQGIVVGEGPGLWWYGFILGD